MKKIRLRKPKFTEEEEEEIEQMGNKLSKYMKEGKSIDEIIEEIKKMDKFELLPKDIEDTMRKGLNKMIEEEKKGLEKFTNVNDNDLISNYYATKQVNDAIKKEMIKRGIKEKEI